MSPVLQAATERDSEFTAVVSPAERLGRLTAPPLPRPDRRRYPRATYRSLAVGSVGPWPRRQRLAGVVYDLSSTGLAVQFSGGTRLVPGMTLRLRVTLPSTPGRPDGNRLCTVTGTVMWARVPLHASRLLCGIRLDQLVAESVAASGHFWQRVGILAIAVSLMGVIMVLKTYNVIWFWYDPPFQLYSVIVTSFILSRTALSLFYRVPPDRGFLPTVSIVIAVKNEEAHIAETVQRCFRSRYPADRLEVLVIDDGSTDRTWAVLQGLVPRYADLRVFRFAANRGKRHAMALGAERARGEILVYIDSDSYVDPEGVYRIVQGFADPRIGAVAGHVAVIVESTNLISKMESVRYFISHRVMKAAESLFGCVTCCSGAFSAYRRSAVMAILPAWLNQTFLGAKATFGDDRSLTNFILRRFRVIFCETARCQTYVPSTWPVYFRQQLRWKKSWSRETLIASSIIWRKHPIAALSYYAGVTLTLFAPLMAVRNMVVLPLFYSMSCLPYLFGLTLVYLFFCCIYSYCTRAKYWAYGLAFAGLYISVLCWQNYYAIATVSRTHWGTR